MKEDNVWRNPMRFLIPRSVVSAVSVLIFTSSYSAWAQQPVAPPSAVWTPTSAAPKDLLTALEGERHDRFIARAKAGDIDIVFFGTTDTEMWSWPDRGRAVWDRAFGSLKAANF